ncbi:class I SAM-dependent methyltransferase [Patescibacteria group bacterium]|nr:class I SAM-dependent methyltransferase [Patescibacteria group bacterium]MBU2035976.1 class I SAM-dependent methyltransferase [Patescibacteria group bacterium]
MENINTDINILYDFITRFWFVPSDAYLRTIETIIWNKYSFKNKKVLAIGIGDGRYDSLIFKKHKTIDYGIDNDKDSVNRSIGNKLYKKVFCESAEEMHFRDNYFDLVISNSTFEHIKNDIKAISEVSRVLKKKGKFLFCLPTKRLPQSLKKIGVSKDEIKWFNKRVSHLHYYSLREWKDILRKNNLRINKYYYYMDENILKVWWKLFKISVFKPYHRELWSYLKDSPYGKLAPKKLIIHILKYYLKNRFNDVFNENGVWLFIESEKI